MLIDAHLDLAYNACLGRDLTLDLSSLRQHDPVKTQTATTTLPELRAAGVKICFGTLFLVPDPAHPAGYGTPQQAYDQARRQLDQYCRWEDAGELHILRTRAEVGAHLDREDAGLGVVLLMEGADPIRQPDELSEWVAQGVRIIGPAWERTRYAGGTGQPGPLSALGRELVSGMAELGVTLDASHLDDAAFWDAHELGVQLIATHANARTLVPGNRQLSDEMARAVADRGGVIGLVLLSRFIRPDWAERPERVSLAELARHAEHYAALVGWTHVGLGTDLDGGFGNERTPLGIDRYQDLPRLLEALPAPVRQNVAAGNWARWLRERF